MTPPRSHVASPVTLWDMGGGAPTEAELWDRITARNLEDWEKLWIPALRERTEAVAALGRGLVSSSASGTWHWRNKLAAIQGKLTHQSYAIVRDGVTHAMMIVDHTQRAKIAVQRDQHLVYIGYIEAAPWNRAEFGVDAQQLSGCGTLLVGTAMKLSLEEGFKGRIGLHSLAQSNDFYANHCELQDLGPEPDHRNLRYFEATPGIAQQFLGKGNMR